MPTNAEDGLPRLLTWLSPAFPTGSYSYSHGIEYAVEVRLITDAASLRAWIDSILRHGSGRADAILFGEAWRAERDRDDQRLGEVLAWGQAFRGTAELALESSAQGRAFVAAVRAGWPHPRLDTSTRSRHSSTGRPRFPLRSASPARSPASARLRRGWPSCRRSPPIWSPPASA
jgi:urease accessory protein